MIYNRGGFLPPTLSSVFGGPCPELIVPPPSERITRRRVRPWSNGRADQPSLQGGCCVEPCPECAVGKCGCCDGTALDHERDEITQCPCSHS